MIWRLLKPQGAIGLAVCALFVVLLAIEKRESSRWRVQAQQAETSFKAEQAASAQTVANYRAAAAAAQAVDAANLQRVTAEQSAINQRSNNDYEARIDGARALARRLQQQAAAGATHSGDGGAAAMPGVPARAQAAPHAAGEDGFPLADRLTATEQAVQLDALIKWIEAQGAVDQGNGSSATGVR